MNILDWIVIIWLGIAFVVGMKLGRMIPFIKSITGLVAGVVMVAINVVIISRVLTYILELPPDHQIELMIQQSRIGSWLILAGSWMYGYVS